MEDCIEDTPEINIGTELNNKQQNQIQQLVGEYSDVFRTEPGRAKFYEHQLTPVSYTHLDVYKRQK